MKNIQPVVDSRLCLKCGACYSVCRESAITIAGDIDKRPEVTGECTRCGRCVQVCPGLNPLVHERETVLGPAIACYIGYSEDAFVRFNASSGGIITSMNMHLLSTDSFDGIVCVRQSKQNLYENEVILAQSADEILSASGSRYSPAFVCRGIRDLSLKKGRRYIFVGKPCDIQAAIKYERLEKGFEFLKIALFCAQTPSMEATREAVTSGAINTSEAKAVQYRGNGWPGWFRVLASDGSVLLQRRYHDVWNSILCRRKYSNKRCFLCHDCTGEFADIAVGDAWLPQYMGNSPGHSIVITRTPRGQETVDRCIDANVLHLEETDQSNVIKAQTSLLSKKKNLFLKKMSAVVTLEKVPNERIRWSLRENDIRRIPGLMKYFVLHRLRV